MRQIESEKDVFVRGGNDKVSRFVIQIADVNGIILKREDSDITNIAEWWKTCSEELSPYVRENDQPRLMALEAFCVGKKGLDLFRKKYEKNFFPNVDTKEKVSGAINSGL